MKVSEKQLIMLTDIAKQSLQIAGLFGGYDLPIRIQLVNDLINQQSNKLKEVDTDELTKIFENLENEK